MNFYIKNLSILFTLSCLSAFSQTVFFNNGQDVVLNNDVQFIVKEGDFINDGYVKNEGHAWVEGDYVNNEKTEGGNLNSEFLILKNWENNSSFLANNGTVILNGIDQYIEGIEESHFFNLTFENNGIKTMNIHSSVDGFFRLNTSELATTDYKMTLLNPDVNSLIFSENIGFVSSTNNGRFVRNTNSINSYIFPTGENIGTLKYRPIRIQPVNSFSNQYEVRFVNSNADYDGYDFYNKNPLIKNFNENFYHLINQSIGSNDASLTVFYKPSEDGNWEDVAQWNNKWENLSATNNTPTDFSSLTYKKWISNNNEAHILINLEECKLKVPTGFSPNGNNINENFHVLNNCDLEKFSISIYDRWGELIFTSDDLNSYWDGTYKGENSELGVYTWYLNYKLKGDDNLKIEKGNVTLVR